MGTWWCCTTMSCYEYWIGNTDSSCCTNKKPKNLIYRASAVLDDTNTRLPREATILVWIAGTNNI
jgi:hypothetical protein